MRNSEQDYRWMKYKSGKSYFAIVNLDIIKNETGNEIIENYSGNGYSNHSIDVGKEGMETWKKGLIKGLEFALLHSSDFWTITINKVEGKPVTDSNPAIIGYVGILSFSEQTRVEISAEIIDNLEDFVFHSWNGNNAEKIPNFDTRTFL
jgi:hypothetical protein